MFRLKLIITQVVSVLAIALAGFPLISVGQHYNHDQIGRLSSVVYPSGDGVRYEYDTRDNLVRIGTFLAPTPPTDVSITRLPENKAQLTWAHPINDRVEIIGFFIEAANIGSADWQPLQLDPPIGPTERTATVYLSDGEQDFRIVAIEGFTRSAPSSTVRLAAQEALLVTTLVDENDHQLGRGEGDSLREVIEAAAPGDRIEFAIEPGDQTFLPLDIGFLPPPAVGLLPLPPAAPPFSTILLRAIELVIDKDLTIDASGVPGGITIDAFHECRVLRIIGDVKVTLKDLTILNGFADDGGGIFSDQAELELQNCHLVGNEAVYGGGLFSLEGRVTMLEGSVSDNVATGNGGGIFLIDSELTVRFGEVSGNAAGFWGGGVINNGGTVTIENSSLYNNHADRAGGGLFNSDGVMLVVNSTLSGNSSGTNEGGAAVNPFFDPDRDATMTLRHCTIAGNVGGGVLNESPSVLVLDNTILANNTKLNAPLDMEGDFTAIGANVVRAQIGGTRLSGPAPLTSDPLLDDLASYGASSTMPPLVGSPVIDAGVVTANTPSTDQESSSRPYGPAPDIGAVESRLSADTDLKWLTTTAGTILPTFRSKRLDYSVTVSSSVTLAAVRPAANVFGQTIDVRINGGAWATVDSKDSSADLPLFPGENPIQVRVTAENGSTTKTYTLKVIRGAREETNTELTSLSLSAGALSPAFQPATVDYDTFAANEVTGTTVTATPAEKGTTMAVRSNYGPFVPLVSGVASAPLVLKVGDNAIDVKITSKDGGTSLTYTVVVSRAAPDSSNADLASLSTDVGSLSPPFSRGRSVYRITTDEKTAASVTASVAQSGATMKLSVNGGSATTLNSGEASTSFGLAEGENIIRIIVTAVDGTTVHPYTLIITRIIEGVAVASADSQDAASQDASISGDGRFGAFSSSDSSLLVGDTNNAADIFVYDRMEDTLERISVDNNGIEGNDDSSRPSISADGRYVAFQSEATNLVPNDTNGDTERSRGSDIFVHDRIANATERISLTDSGGEANQASESPSISGDGRYVAFVSGANNLVTGYANGEFNVYVYDREATDPAEAITGISVPFGNYAANLNSLNPAISSDGSYVAFELSVDKSVDSTPGYQYRDIWLYNRATTGVERITGTEIGPSADTTDSRAPSISADGRFIAFESNLESLDFYDTNLAVDVFLYDRMDKSIRRVSSKAAQGGEDYMQSRNPSISGDGRYVAFESQASNLVDDDTNGSADIFLKDLQTGEIVRLSETLVGAEGNADSLLPSVSFDGRSVAYQTDATNLKANNTNDSTDVIVAFIKALNPSSLADLASLTTNLGALRGDGITYSAGVVPDLTMAWLRPMAADPGATLSVRVNGGAFEDLPADGLASVKLEPGANTIEIRVRSADESTFTYTTIHVARVVPSSNAALANLVTSSGSLSPAFSGNATVYSVAVSNGTSSLTVRPTAADAMALVAVNGVPVASGVDSGAIALKVGTNNILVTVLAEDGVTGRTYALAVTRAFNPTDLFGLYPSFGFLSPAFSPATTTYTLNVPYFASEVTFQPTVAIEGATVTVNGESVDDGSSSSPISLAVGENTVNVVVTAAGGGATRTYSVTVIRQEEVITGSRLANLSIRTTLAISQKLIVGFVMQGGGKEILVRAAGPAMNNFGLSGLPDPRLELYDSTSTLVTANEDWPSELSVVFTALGAFDFEPGSLDAAFLQSLSGPHTVHVRGAGSGLVLVEAYDAGSGTDLRLVNLSARNRVGTGPDILIAGFVIDGTGTKTVLIRGIGPKLEDFSVTNFLADPLVGIFDASNAKIAENDDWDASLMDTFTALGAFALPVGSKDAALIVTLPAGASYTVKLRGADGGTGQALVEIYEVE